MKKLLILILASWALAANAQVFQVDTLHYSGEPVNHLNFVIMGDGYTASEQDKFHNDAQVVTTSFFSQPPYLQYASHFNVFAVRVISAESGAKHPGTAGDCPGASHPQSNPDNYFGSAFDVAGIHRLIVALNTAKVINVLSANVPLFDQVIILVNTPFYGGSGGNFSTFSTHPLSGEIGLHEIGHSFGTLADEYYAGDIYAGEKLNMTAQTNPALVKWKNWMGTGGTGIYQHCCGGQSAQWYKPHQNCKMQFLGSPFCPVCLEGSVERIHDFVNPVIAYEPLALLLNTPDRFIDFSLTELVKPEPNTLKFSWTLDNIALAADSSSYTLDQDLLSPGDHSLAVKVIDTTELVRVTGHAAVHVSVVQWTIRKTATGVQAGSSTDRIKYTIFPNPSASVLNIAVELARGELRSLEIRSAEGRLILDIPAGFTANGKYTQEINIENLVPGIYYLKLNTTTDSHVQPFVKQ